MHVDWEDLGTGGTIYLAVAVLTAVFGVGRLTRVLTYDSYPPAVWVRNKWSALTKDGDWSLLARCFWCASPWVMAVAMAWFWWGTTVVWVGVAWWIFWGWLALSYVSAMVIARDDPHDE